MKISEIKIHGIKSYVDATTATSDYTVFVGENNSGKSNILFALLWFFGKEKLALKDINRAATDDPYVEIEFKLNEGEEFSHPAEYLVDGKFKIRATLARGKITEKAAACEYFGYTGNTEDTIKDTKLLGWKTVARPSFGDVIYIPSVRPLSEELKFTANSSLNQLVTKNIITRIKLEDEKNQHYSNETLTNLRENSPNSLTSIGDVLKDRMQKWQIPESVAIRGPSGDTVVRPPDEVTVPVIAGNLRENRSDDNVTAIEQGPPFINGEKRADDPFINGEKWVDEGTNNMGYDLNDQNIKSAYEQ